jgi:hypothetical protein
MRTRSRRGVRAALAVVLAGTAIAAVIAPVGAATPQQVTITASMSKQGFGTFEATGTAVETGLLCERGTVLDIGSVVGGYRSGHKIQVLSRKELTCADGSGTFFVKLQIHVVFGGDEPFTWVVQGGTGDYAGIQGSGSGVTADNTSTSNTNIYDGFLTP